VVTEDDSAGRGVGEPRRVGEVEGPGVEPGRGDGAQEGVRGDRVLIGRREEQQEAGAVGQGADFLAAAAQECRGLRGKRGAQDPYAHAIGKSHAVGSAYAIGKSYPVGSAYAVWVSYPVGRAYAVRSAYVVGELGAEALPRVRELRWRSVRERRGVHRSHHTYDVTGELTGK
jgi:hypothetical protein